MKSARIIGISLLFAITNAKITNLANQKTSQNKVCESSKLKQCGDAFGKSLGITKAMSGQDFVKFFYDYQQKNGVAGIKQICESSKALHECLGDEVDSCFSSLKIATAFHIGWLQSLMYVFEMQGLEYMCIDQPQVFDKNIECIAKVGKDQYIPLLKCADALNKGAGSHPLNACKYLYEFAMCNKELYKSCGNETVQAVCKKNAKQALAVYPGCFIDC